MSKDLLSTLDGTWSDGTRPADLYELHVAKRPEDYVGPVLEGLASKKKRVRAGCAELASRISADRPELLYPHIEVFFRHLREKAPILRWEAVCTIGNMAAVDTQKLIPKHVPEIVALLEHESIVLQGHAVRALAKIATVHPRLAKSIFESLTAATQFFPGTRVGYIVESMEQFAGQRALVPSIRAFLTPYLESRHAPVARKAKKAIKRLPA